MGGGGGVASSKQCSLTHTLLFQTALARAGREGGRSLVGTYQLLKIIATKSIQFGQNSPILLCALHREFSNYTIKIDTH